MTPEETLPSYQIRMLRCTAREMLRPGRVLTDVVVATVLASINTCAAIAEDYEEDTAILRALLTPPRPPVPAEQIAHRQPVLRLITCSPGEGGDAA